MGRLATTTTQLIEKVLRKAKEPLTMGEILDAVLEHQKRTKASRLISRRDVYNAIHNNVGARFKAMTKKRKDAYAVA